MNLALGGVLPIWPISDWLVSFLASPQEQHSLYSPIGDASCFASGNVQTAGFRAPEAVVAGGSRGGDGNVKFAVVVQAFWKEHGFPDRPCAMLEDPRLLGQVVARFFCSSIVAEQVTLAALASSQSNWQWLFQRRRGAIWPCVLPHHVISLNCCLCRRE